MLETNKARANFKKKIKNINTIQSLLFYLKKKFILARLYALTILLFNIVFVCFVFYLTFFQFDSMHVTIFIVKRIIKNASPIFFSLSNSLSLSCSMLLYFILSIIFAGLF